METYRNRGIRDIIATFPRVEEILGEYGIGCGTCSVGVCQLKDVVEIHSLPAGKEKELMKRIEAVIYPERFEGEETVAGPVGAVECEHIFSPPLQLLVDEHTLIKRWLALIPALLANVDPEEPEGRAIYLDGVDLIRSYADRKHHGKEEDILFSYFDDSDEIFQVMYEDHRLARDHVGKLAAALEEGDGRAVRFHLNGYAALLAEHIKKEDEILFPWLDRRLSERQLEEMAERFAGQDRSAGVDDKRYRSFVEGLEKRFANG